MKHAKWERQTTSGGQPHNQGTAKYKHGGVTPVPAKSVSHKKLLLR